MSSLTIIVLITSLAVIAIRQDQKKSDNCVFFVRSQSKIPQIDMVHSIGNLGIRPVLAIYIPGII
jgi:hypothetical protein